MAFMAYEFLFGINLECIAATFAGKIMMVLTAITGRILIV
jgi:hypothetical protein